MCRRPLDGVLLVARARLALSPTAVYMQAGIMPQQRDDIDAGFRIIPKRFVTGGAETPHTTNC